MIIWALFDSGNGCYTQAVEKYFPDVEIYPIGIDIENKNDHFINLNLADYSDLFGKSKMFAKLDTLPKPDVILASPPCESWSAMTNIKNGSFSWKMKQEITCLFDTHIVDTPFTVQTKEDFYKAKEKLHEYQGFKRNNQFQKSTKSRINGELCVLNTIDIIERYKPFIWIIENPAHSRMWDYMDKIHDFRGTKNLACYNDYDVDFSQKPTIFLSNADLELVATRTKSNKSIKGDKKKGIEHMHGYNERSNIPLPLIKHIIEMCLKELNKYGRFTS